MSKPIIVWFRQDLRLSDNPALYHAAVSDEAPVLPIYILDDEAAGAHAMGAASRWWLHYALESLKTQLEGNLHIFQGNTEEIIADLLKHTDASALHYNRCYEPWRTEQDAGIIQLCEQHDVSTHHFNGSLLWEPWDIAKKDGTPYKVFTPYYRKGCLGARAPREPLAAPQHIAFAKAPQGAMSITKLRLLPNIPWDKALEPHWNISEAGAQSRLYEFIEEGLPDYKEGRNYPALPHISRLSPYLHHGQISPHQVWYAVEHLEAQKDKNHDHFQSELGWREFSHHLLHHFPDLPTKNLQSKFDAFPWRTDADALRCWQRGITGYPMVDAAMRQLWQTGYMHNRLRLLAASFLVKNLRLHWHEGEAWFWDCLVDADLANNSASWQWIAGCGADAAPYFRIFNPVTQGHKFDKGGEFTRHYVPELKHLPDKYLFSPWEAPEHVLEGAGVKLGSTYPRPVVDMQASRDAALEAFHSLKSPNESTP